MSERYRNDDITPADGVVAVSARQLRPGVLNEEQWLRRSHADIPYLPEWQLRRELRVVSAYVDTPQARRSWELPWWVERRERLLAELRHRRQADQHDRHLTPSHRDRWPAVQRPRPATRRLSVSLPWRRGGGL